MRREAGFGLLEVVISAGILATVVSASVALMNQSLKRAVLASERTTAMNLASEALEQVRMVRDSTYIDGQPNSWDDWTSAGSPVPCADPQNPEACTVYRVVMTSGRVQLTDAGGAEQIVLDGRTYTRRIILALPDTPYTVPAGIPADDDLVIRKVIVTVSWGTGPAESVESITYLTDWRSGV